MCLAGVSHLDSVSPGIKLDGLDANRILIGIGFNGGADTVMYCHLGGTQHGYNEVGGGQGRARGGGDLVVVQKYKGSMVYGGE